MSLPLLPIVTALMAGRLIARPAPVPNSVTVPITLGETGLVEIPASIDGKAALALLAIEDPVGVVFGNPNEVGEPTEADVKVGGIDFGKIAVHNPINDALQAEVQSGVGAIVASDSLRDFKIAFDFQKGTVTFWKSAKVADLQSWVLAGSDDKAFASTDFTSVKNFPILVRQVVGGKEILLGLTSRQPIVFFRPSSSAVLTTVDATMPANTGRLRDTHLVRYAFPTSSTNGWTWMGVHDDPVLHEAGVDGVACPFGLNLSRMIIDWPRHKVFYPVESDFERFAGWLSTTTQMPLAAIGGKIVWAPDHAFFWTVKGALNAPPVNSEVVRIGGYDLATLRTAFESSDKTHGKLLERFAESIHDGDYDSDFVSDGKKFKFHVLWDSR